VLDPVAFREEVELLRKEGIQVEGRLFISQNTHLIMPYHKLLDKASEEKQGEEKIGTTGRGIGPAYVDKVNRKGIRIVDLLHPEQFEKKLRKNIEEKNNIIKHIYGKSPINVDDIITEYLDFDKEIDKYVKDISIYLSNAINDGKKVLLEGAQGTLLDVDHGTYPFVTSSNPSSGGACIGVGIGPTRITEVIGVFKAYTTRVGQGPFPTELHDTEGEFLRSEGSEFGATTGRPRRCGWFDALVAKYSIRINGIDSLAITKLDVLDKLEKIKICTAYKYENKILNDFPADLQVLQQCEPVYEEVSGWQVPTSDIKNWDDLPDNAKHYLEFVESIVQKPIHIISVGSKRSQTIFRKQKS
jgi:adenylosuccinate synthase